MAGTIQIPDPDALARAVRRAIGFELVAKFGGKPWYAAHERDYEALQSLYASLTGERVPEPQPLPYAEYQEARTDRCFRHPYSADPAMKSSPFTRVATGGL